MPFSVKDTVAVVTGAAQGIGFEIAKELLKTGAKGVTIADCNQDLGNKALVEIQNTFGEKKAIFVPVDVRNIEQFEEVFKKTIKAFKYVDILVNNAGILNDKQWNDEIDINVKGTVNGILLGLEKYLQTNRSGNEGVILNISSIAGVQDFGSIPVYASTKFAIHGMTLSWGAKPHYDRTKVRVVAICPGGTTTNLLATVSTNNFGPVYEDYRLKYEGDLPVQTTAECANGALKVIEYADTGTVWVVEGAETPYQFILPDRSKLKDKNYVVT